MKAFVITIESHKGSQQVANRCIKSAEKYGIKIEKWKATTPHDIADRDWETNAFIFIS